MTTERDPGTRIVLSWLREDAHENAERVLLHALDVVDATPQRRPSWPAWRVSSMNSYTKLAIAAAAVVVVALAGYQLLPRNGNIGGQPTAPPSPSPSAGPTLLARGNFTMLQEAAVQLDATGGGSGVTGVMTVNDAGPGWTVDLKCSRTTPGGLIVIGGDITASTHSEAKAGTRMAIVIERGSRVKAFPHFEDPEPPASTCLAFLETVTDAGAADALTPIRGTIEFGP